MKEDTKALRKRIKSLEQQLALLEDDLYRQKRQKRMKKTGMTLEEILEEEALISKAVNEAMDEVEKQLEDEEDGLVNWWDTLADDFMASGIVTRS